MDSPATPALRVRDAVRIRGTIAGSEGAVPLGDASMAVSGAEPVAHVLRAPFDLVLEGGDRVRVEVAEGDALQILSSERSVRGPWSEVEADPLARVFSDRAPGPHVAVKLRGKCASVGDTIDVLAEVVSYDPIDGPASMREAPARRIAAVRPIAVAIGSGEASKMESLCREHIPALRRDTFQKRAPIEWKRVMLVAAITAGLGVLAIAMISSRVVVVDVLSFVVSFGIAAYEMSQGVAVPSFRVGGEERPEVDRVLPGALSMLLLLLALVFTVIHAIGALLRASADYILVAPLASAGALIVSTLALYASTRYATRIARLLLDTAPHPPGLPDGAWGTSAGRVADPTPLLTTSVPTAMALVKTVGTPEFVHEGTFVVETDAGSVEIDPRRALWATLVTTSRKVDDKLVFEELVPVGGSVAVAGRLRRVGDAGPVLAATGPESLVLFATPGDQPALDALRRFLRDRRRLLLLLPGGALAILALAAAVLR